jgi:hypothetical protein
MKIISVAICVMTSALIGKSHAVNSPTLTVTAATDAKELAAMLAKGGNVIVSNAAFGGHPSCAGLFADGDTVGAADFPESGVVLSSGTAESIEGPNDNYFTTDTFGTRGDVDLNEQNVAIPTTDACVLTFNFRCPRNLVDPELRLKYAFETDENRSYFEFLRQADVMGFFLNGGDNFAKFPGTDTDVRVHPLFLNYLRDNFGNGYNIEANGFTTKLTAVNSEDMRAGTNTLKIAIADVNSAHNIWVLLENGSVECTGEVGPHVVGDPHFSTWSGDKYDFHGVCDLVLLTNPSFRNGLGMDIHLRNKKTRLWSYVSSVVIRIGHETLEVIGGIGETRLWINKQERQDKELTTEKATIAGHPVVFQQINTSSRSFTIALTNDAQVLIKTWKGYVSVHIHGADDANFGKTLGLMGAYPSGDKLARDNTTLIQDHNLFGLEWQVRPTDGDLFHDVDGPQFPQQCEIPSTSALRRRLGESVISKEDAQLACARVSLEDFDLCVFDVMATNDKDAVGAY